MLADDGAAIASRLKRIYPDSVLDAPFSLT
jgi:hypothetical protein